MIEIVGRKIRRLLQSKPKSRGVVLEEFGESHWIDLVAELNDGSYLSIHEYECDYFTGNTNDLYPVELVQDEYRTESVVDKKIIDIHDSDNEFAIALENGLFLCCLGAPGGNYPWIYSKNDKAAEQGGADNGDKRRV